MIYEYIIEYTDDSYDKVPYSIVNRKNNTASVIIKKKKGFFLKNFYRYTLSEETIRPDIKIHIKEREFTKNLSTIHLYNSYIAMRKDGFCTIITPLTLHKMISLKSEDLRWYKIFDTKDNKASILINKLS